MGRLSSAASAGRAIVMRVVQGSRFLTERLQACRETRDRAGRRAGKQEVRANLVVSLDLRPFRVVAGGLRDRSDLGRKWLEITTPAKGFGPFSRVSAVGAEKSV